MKRRRKVLQKHNLPDLRARAFYAQGGRCYWCDHLLVLGGALDDPWRATADHLVPVYAGGKTWPGNIVASCQDCNAKRTAMATNRRKASEPPIVIGDDTPRSPFEILRRREQ